MKLLDSDIAAAFAQTLLRVFLWTIMLAALCVGIVTLIVGICS